MMYQNEVSKIRDKVMKYLKGRVIDIGGYNCKVIPTAFCIDGRKADGVDLVTDNLYTLAEQGVGYCDVAFSSHTLEHLRDDYCAIKSWSKLIKPDGYLILYLPEGSRYNSKENAEHMREYTYDNFVFWFKRCFCGEGKDFRGNNFRAIFQIMESGEDPIEEDLYSFFIVAKKI